MKLPFKIICFLLLSFLTYAQNGTGKYPPNYNAVIPAINFKDTDIKDILRSLAFEYETNIVVDNQVEKKVSVALFNTTVFNAVKIISEDNGLEFSFDAQRFNIKPKAPQSPPPPQVAVPKVKYEKEKLSVEADGVEVEQILEALREKTKRNFMLTTGSAGRITGVLNNIELEKGLKNLFQNNGFYVTEKDSIYYITRSNYFSSVSSQSGQGQQSAYWVSGHGNNVTIDVKQAPLDKIIDDLSNQMGLQIVKLTVPDALVTVKCSEVSLKKAFEYIFKGTQFTYKEDRGTYIIGGKETKSLDKTKIVKLNYLQADKMKEQIPAGLLLDVTINTSIEQNAIIINGKSESVGLLEDYLVALDQPVPQVLIEALVVDYNLDNIYKFGITAGRGDSSQIAKADKWYPGIDATASGDKINKFLNSLGSVNIFGKDIDFAKLGKLPADFYVNLKAMEQKGIANVRSKPLLSTLNGHTATLKIGTVQNYVFTEIMPIASTVSTSYIEKETIQKIEANISFEITPWVGQNHELTLEIKPDFETPVGEFSPDKNLIPAINKRSLFSTVRLRDGETIVLGGLIQETESNTEDRMPFLGDIPFLGELFKNVDKAKGKAELIIYLTPRIYYGDEFSASTKK